MAMAKDVDPVDASAWTGNGPAYQSANRTSAIRASNLVLTAFAVSAAKAAIEGQWVAGLLLFAVGAGFAFLWRRKRA